MRCCGGEHGGDRVSIAFCHAGVSITSRARLTACRSPDLPRRRLRCRVGPGVGPCDNENCGNPFGPGRGCRPSRRTDQRTTHTNPVSSDLFETNSCAAGAARQSRPGGRATRWSLPAADGTGAGVPAPSTSGASLPVPPAPRPGGTAEYAGLPQQPSTSNGSASVAVSVPAASVAAKSNSSLTKPARSDHGRGIPGQSQLASLRHRRRSATNRRRNLPVSLSIELPN